MPLVSLQVRASFRAPGVSPGIFCRYRESFLSGSGICRAATEGVDYVRWCSQSTLRMPSGKVDVLGRSQALIQHVEHGRHFAAQQRGPIEP